MNLEKYNGKTIEAVYPIEPSNESMMRRYPNDIKAGMIIQFTDGSYVTIEGGNDSYNDAILYVDFNEVEQKKLPQSIREDFNFVLSKFIKEFRALRMAKIDSDYLVSLLNKYVTKQNKKSGRFCFETTTVSRNLALDDPEEWVIEFIHAGRKFELRWNANNYNNYIFYTKGYTDVFAYDKIPKPPEEKIIETFPESSQVFKEKSNFRFELRTIGTNKAQVRILQEYINNAWSDVETFIKEETS